MGEKLDDKRKADIIKLREHATNELNRLSKIISAIPPPKKGIPSHSIRAKIPVRISQEEKDKLQTKIQEQDKNAAILIDLDSPRKFEGKVKVVERKRDESIMGREKIMIKSPKTRPTLISPRSKEEGPMSRRKLMEQVRERQLKKKKEVKRG